MTARGEIRRALAARWGVLIAACLVVACVAANAQTPPQITAPDWKLSTALGPAYPQGKETTMEVLYPCCCGLDVHKKSIHSLCAMS